MANATLVSSNGYTPIEGLATGIAGDTESALRVAHKCQTLHADATLAPTEAIDSGALNTGSIADVVVVISNGNTTQTRQPVFTFMDEAGATLHTITPAAIAASTTATYAFGQGAVATGITAAYPFTLSPKFKVTAAAPASGTGNGYASIWGR